MKSDKKQEIKNMTDTQLTKRLDQISEELVKINLDLKMGKLKNTSTGKALRYERALIKTVLAEKIANQ